MCNKYNKTTLTDNSVVLRWKVVIFFVSKYLKQKMSLACFTISRGSIGVAGYANKNLRMEQIRSDYICFMESGTSEVVNKPSEVFTVG